VYANSLDLEHSSIVGSFNVEKINIKEYPNSQTLTKLKNEAIKKNDTINAIEYKAKEMWKYKKELKKVQRELRKQQKELKFNNYKEYFGILTKRFEIIGERILVCLNTLSNKNEKSWTRGLLFTVVAAIVFFFLLNYGGTKSDGRLFYWGWVDLDSFLGVWVRFLSVVNVFDFEYIKASVADNCLELTSLGKLIFFISKIFVGYGIYQMIAAFRKYGKQ
jgi:hypothetical protein